MRYRPRPEPARRIRRTSSRPLSTRKKLAFSIVAVTGLLVFLELGARLIERAIPPQFVDYGQGFDSESRLYAPSADSPTVLATRPEKMGSFRPQEFTVPKPPGTFRIFALGGSSVNYLDDELRALESRLKEQVPTGFERVEIINSGGLSYGSHRLARLTAEVLTYDPNLIFFYEAHNEFEEVEQLHLASGWLSKPQQAASYSALVRVISFRINAFRVARMEVDHAERLKSAEERRIARSSPDPMRAWHHHFTKHDLQIRMDALRANLTRIVTLCKAQGVPLVVSTVPSNLVNPSLGPDASKSYGAVWALIDRKEYERAASLGRRILAEAIGRHQSSDLENAIIREVCHENAVPLADVEAAIIQAEPHHLPGETLFKDHCHLNAAGNKILASTAEAVILRTISEPVPSSTPEPRRETGPVGN